MAVRRRNEMENDPDQPEARRVRRMPSFRTVVREATIANSIQQVVLAIEPLFRRVVHEEVELMVRHSSAQRHRSSQWCIGESSSSSSSLQLTFSKPLSLPVFSGSKMGEQDNNSLHILLTGTETSEIPHVRSGSPIKVEIVVLNGDFAPGDREDWTSDDFNSNILKERDGKRPLLVGERVVKLSEGMAYVGELVFTDNSSWVRSGKFRLGARVLPGSYEGPRIKEAVTEAFPVKDHRSELHKKHHPPALGDEVWRLEKIGKDGKFHKRLEAEGIKTVQDFLMLWNINPGQLRKILGTSMSDRMWEVTIKHAKTCTMGKELFLDGSQNFGVISNEPMNQGVVGFSSSHPIHQENLSLNYQHEGPVEVVSRDSAGLQVESGNWVQGSIEFSSSHPSHQSMSSKYDQDEGLVEVVATSEADSQMGTGNWIHGAIGFSSSLPSHQESRSSDSQIQGFVGLGTIEEDFQMGNRNWIQGAVGFSSSPPGHQENMTSGYQIEGFVGVRTTEAGLQMGNGSWIQGAIGFSSSDPSHQEIRSSEYQHEGIVEVGDCEADVHMEYGNWV